MKSIRLGIALSILFASLLTLTIANVANAQYKGWSAIKETGYAVTSNFQGVDVPIGTDVWVTAGTTDLTVDNVTFIWHFPNDTVAFTDFVEPLTQFTAPAYPDHVPPQVIEWATNASNQGVVYLVAQSSHTIEGPPGDWGVQAIFRDDVNIKGLEATAIRATSFNVIPEVPLGTLVITLSMFGALSIFAIRKKRMTVKP